MLTFVQSSYMVSEDGGSIDIEVTKENQVISEQVLSLAIQLAPGGSATEGLQSYIYLHVCTINEQHFPYKTGVVMQSHLLCRTRFGQYQASLAVLGCMHRLF